MRFLLLAASLTAFGGQDSDPARSEVELLLDTIDALQQPIEDFQCEFEGPIRFQGKGGKGSPKTGPGGLVQSFSGMFVWKRGGEIYTDILRRGGYDATLERETLVIHARERRAEQYRRLNDAARGSAMTIDPEHEFALIRFPLYLFSTAYLRHFVATSVPSNKYWLSDDRIQGRPLKVINHALEGVPGSVFARLWVDLGRTGQVVRAEFYFKGNVLHGRNDIELAPFTVDGTEVWMPVSGQCLSYATGDPKNPASKRPTVIETIRVVDGSMQFNKHPGRDVFTVKYKPGTVISDNLGKLQYEFGQQKIGLNPTKAEAEKMLKDSIAEAETQKAQLAVASSTEGFDWTYWLAWGFGAALVISSVALLIQRRRHWFSLS